MPSSRYNKKKPLMEVSMNILLIYLEGDKSKANATKSLFDKKEFSFKPLVLSDPKEAAESFDIQLAAFFALNFSQSEDLKHEFTPSQMLIISKLPASCFDFLAGYSCAFGLSFPVFGEDAMKGIPNAFFSCFLPLKTDEELKKFFMAGREAYVQSETERASEKARNTLLKMGISVNVDSLVKCAADGCIHEISLFLAVGFSPDTLSSNGVPLLNIAARKGNRETLRLLILSGAQLDLLSHDRGSTALIDSVMGKHRTIAKDLIKAGADVNLSSKDGQSALIIAVGAGDATIAEALLEAGADPDFSDHLGVSARKYASLFHNKPIVELFEAIPLHEESF